MVQVKRIYEEPSNEDGYRVLVDRLWPRGVSKQKAAIDLWLKEVAPSPSLRQWFDHRPERFEEFSLRYTDELRNNPALQQLSDEIARHGTVTLLYAAHDQQINHAVVLRKFLSE